MTNELYNNPMQHGAAMHINKCMEDLHYEYKAPMVLQMHDEIMLEVPISSSEYWARTLQATMERPCAELSGTVFPVDVNIADTWGGLK